MCYWHIYKRAALLVPLYRRAEDVYI